MKILFTGNPDFTECEIFMKFFPNSLILRIVECTNELLQILSEIISKEQKKNVLIPLTDYGEILIVFGTRLIMSYNRLPEFHNYWSGKRTLRNALIREVISRDRFCLVFSKLYLLRLKSQKTQVKFTT